MIANDHALGESANVEAAKFRHRNPEAATDREADWLDEGDRGD